MNADPAPYSAEHDEPWPGGRSNHYLFDMNRDWFAQSQPETRGRIKIGLEFQPQITVDLHEQGGDNAYYFSPPAEAINPHVTKSQIAGVGAARHAPTPRASTSAAGPITSARSTTRSIPATAIPGRPSRDRSAMTYEQASARGLAFARSDGDTLTYRDGVMHHFNAAIVTAITAARNREQFMRDYLEYRRSAVAEGEKGPIREYVIVPGQDRVPRRRCWRSNLATQGIEVRRAEEPIKLAARTIPAGAYIVSNAQPTARMIRNLLDPKTEQSAEFIKKQEERRKMRLNDQIYDITAWNLPMLFDVEMVTSPSAISVKSTTVPSQYDAPMPARAAAGRQGRLPDAVGIGGGRAVGRCDAAGHPHPQRRRRVHAERPPLSDRHRVHPQRRRTPPISTRSSPRWPRSTAPSWCRSIRRGSTTAPRSAATTSRALKTPKVLLAWDTPTQDAVRRLDALRARAPLRRRRHRGSHQLARPRQLQRLRRHRAAVGKLRRPDQRSACSIASRIGCAPAARSSRLPRRRDGRPDPVSACWTRPAC